MVLDDLRKIHERDTHGLLEAIARQGEQPTGELALKGGELRGVRNIVYGAMGGSALPALFVSAWASINVPLGVVRDYDLPSYVDSDTLFIAASFSGNTEEILTALRQAQQRGAQIAIITNGGRLERLAEDHDYPFVLLPDSFPRFSLWYGVRALLQVLRKVDVLNESFEFQVKQVSRQINRAVDLWRPEIPAKSNLAKQVALELMGKSVVIYSGPKLFPAAYKWKVNINENAKQVAWVNQYPEFSHNEFTGWSKQPVEKPYAVVELRGTFEQSRVRKRFEVTERLLSGMRPAPFVVNVEDGMLYEQLAWCALLGDYVSVYLAFLNGLDPEPLPLVNKLKQVLKPETYLDARKTDIEGRL